MLLVYLILTFFAGKMSSQCWRQILLIVLWDVLRRFLKDLMLQGSQNWTKKRNMKIKDITFWNLNSTPLKRHKTTRKWPISIRTSLPILPGNRPVIRNRQMRLAYLYAEVENWNWHLITCSRGLKHCGLFISGKDVNFSVNGCSFTIDLF